MSWLPAQMISCTAGGAVTAGAAAQPVRRTARSTPGTSSSGLALACELRGTATGCAVGLTGGRWGCVGDDFAGGGILVHRALVDEARGGARGDQGCRRADPSSVPHQSAGAPQPRSLPWWRSPSRVAGRRGGGGGRRGVQRSEEEEVVVEAVATDVPPETPLAVPWARGHRGGPATVLRTDQAELAERQGLVPAKQLPPSLACGVGRWPSA